MESLKRKLEQLSPEQQKEVEDFTDFLLRHPKTPPSPPPNPDAPPPPLVVAPPPLTVQEPASAREPVKVYELIKKQEPSPSAPKEDPITLLMQEIAVDDSLTENSMDNRKYEPPPPSPATEAVKRVKEKLSQHKENDPAKKMLEWVD